ncbi:hypothetical protein [Enterococcus wangshanyuanii]|uniref:DUF2187 domain-containing protein n=1 Tax=Enterococcus wangshanyuanii TaxID=2005703 RepID=A0ABQ1NZX2_9ENTE|nr:hypothetical protein [Enterococcus wangshanyuanii]GGC88217.1 hypothetical protein GCM10011573_17280 [Enterococcus wangshanyuanii]
MSVKEPNYASGALHILPIKPRPLKKGVIEVGKTYQCDISKTSETWKYPFLGEVLYINQKSAVVKIITTQECDDHLIDRCKHLTVIPFKRMKVVEE